MRHKLKFTITGILIGMILYIIVPVHAAELNGTTGGSLNALNSGYAIARWPWNGGESFVGMSATLRAAETQPPHPTATRVVFRWHRPDGISFDVGPKLLTDSGDTWNGKPVWDAYHTEILDMLGDWGVQALFLDANGRLQGPNPYPTVKIRAISLHVVPEVPLGTIGSITILMATFGVYFLAKGKKTMLQSKIINSARYATMRYYRARSIPTLPSGLLGV